jgi:hypothetical protein
VCGVTHLSHPLLQVISFESDPCGVTGIYGRRGWKGRKYARGNCTEPGLCTCLCKVPYFRKACHKTGNTALSTVVRCGELLWLRGGAVKCVLVLLGK